MRWLTRPKPNVAATPSDCVFAENKWKLLRYRRAEGVRALATPVLLVPSLINRHYVLDLLPGKSFAEFLVAKGHDVYVIDWGTPGDEDRYLTFDAICDGYIGRATRLVAQTSARGKAHLFGYCLGGTLAAIHTAARPDHVASLAAVAAPVQFGDEGLLATWTRSPQFDVNALIDAFGNVPWPLMQAAFSMLRPTLGLSKIVGIVNHVLTRPRSGPAVGAWDDEYLDGVFALETWGNDNVSFPGEAYRRYIEELYRKDALAAGTFMLSGRPARLEQITCPTLAVTFEHDNIVPWQSAAHLIDRVASTDKERVHVSGGHVGAMVSRSASTGLWPTISTWWAERDGATAAATSRRARRAMAGDDVAHANLLPRDR